MNKKTREALLGSIQKWERIAADGGVDLGMDNCPLCQLFYYDKNRNSYCARCPVFQNTGEDCCKDTPYEKWSLHQVDAHEDFIAVGCGGASGLAIKPGCRTCKRLANAEVKFLNGLLTKKEGK